MVRLRYIQTIHYADDSFSLRLPMTITPRYMPSYVDSININQSGYINTQPEKQQVPDTNLITPPMKGNTGTATRLLNTIEFTITLDAGLPLASLDSA